MSEKVGGRVVYQGWGGQGGRDIGIAERGNSYSGATPKNKGLFIYLGNHVLDYVKWNQQIK